MQPVANSDFEVETKFESMGSAQYQDEGIVVEQDASTLLRFDVLLDGFVERAVRGVGVGRDRVGEVGADVGECRRSRSGCG